MNFEPLDPKRALSFLSHPVTIITANDGKTLNGMTAAWTTQISIDPPILCTSISPLRYTWDMLKDVEYFGVCQLSKSQTKESKVFGSKSGRDTNKWKIIGKKPFMGAHEVPLVPDSLAAFVCRKTHQVEQGDHFALFGEVIEAWQGSEEKPLNWHRSKYLESSCVSNGNKQK